MLRRAHIHHIQCQLIRQFLHRFQRPQHIREKTYCRSASIRRLWIRLSHQIHSKKSKIIWLLILLKVFRMKGMIAVTLTFCQENQRSFPILAKISTVICSIPASNTTIERLFSTAKNVVTHKRTRLACEKINELLFLQKNMRNLQQLSNNDLSRKRTASMSSTTTVSSTTTTASS